MKKYVLSFITLFSFLPLFAQVHTDEIKISDDIKLLKLTDKAYIHVSVTEIEGFGNVSSNGLLFIDGGSAYLIDTPVTPEQTETLTKWVTANLATNIPVFIPTHWHNDCMGGIEYLHNNGVASYAYKLTIDIAAKNKLPIPQNGFGKKKRFKTATAEIVCYYPGGGHSLDNIVVWLPSEKVLFGGCLIKDGGSNNLGNTADGDVKAWPKSVQNVLRKYPGAKVVIPGHGPAGDIDIVQHTYNLVNQK